MRQPMEHKQRFSLRASRLLRTRELWHHFGIASPGLNLLVMRLHIPYLLLEFLPAVGPLAGSPDPAFCLMDSDPCHISAFASSVTDLEL